MAIKEYRKHILVCFGKRCSERGSEAILGEFKQRIKGGRLDGVRLSRTGCLKLCRETNVKGEYSPAVIIYPDGIWYARVKVEDVDEIVEKHIDGNSVVERLCYFRMSGS